MACYLCDITDGKPRYLIDQDGDNDPMLYTLDRQWAGYVSSDGASVLSSDGLPLFSIYGNYFYGAGGTVRYSDGGDEPPEEDQEALFEELRRESGMRGYLIRTCEANGVKPIPFTTNQIEIILSSTQMLSVFDHADYFRRVVERLRDQTQIDDEVVDRASKQARQDLLPPPEKKPPRMQSEG